MRDLQQMVLACVDGSALREPVCDYAVWMAKRVDAPLRLLNTIDHHHEMAASKDLSGSFGVDGRDHLLEEMTNEEHAHNKLLIKERKAILQVAKEHVTQAGFADPDVCLQHGSLKESVAGFEGDIRVLVIGARGTTHQNQRNQIGEKLEFLIRSLHCPIFVAYEEFSTPETLMIAYDGSEAADKAVDIVVNSPLYKGLFCHLVYVGKKSAIDNKLKQAAEKLRSAAHIEVESVVLSGKADQVLCEYQMQKKIDVTIMGAFSHSRIHDLLLGSFTVKMLLNSKTPLLLLR